MKKNILIAIVVLLSIISQVSVRAQGWVYHNVGDTIVGRDTIYHYQWWVDDWLNSDTDNTHLAWGVRLNQSPGTNNTDEDLLRYCYTDHPINIIGLAGSFVAVCGVTEVDSTWQQEYLLLYDACADSFPLKKAVPWRPTDPKRYMSLPGRVYSNSRDCCSNLHDNNDLVVPIYEYYFEDKPVTVVDSFYVGATTYSNYWTTPEGIMTPLRHAYYYFIRTNADPGYCDNCYGPYHQYKWKCNMSTFADHDWHFSYGQDYMMVFPIIEIDTGFAHQPDTTPYNCPSVTGTRMVGFQEHAGYVAWNSDSEHTLYRVSYGPSGIQPDEGTLVETTHNFATLTGLDSCQHYVAYVQGVCNHQDSLYYSPWSDSVSIYACNPQIPEPPDTTTTGVRRPDLLDQMTHLVPNPATDVVQVMSSFRMKSLEVYALNGTRLLEQEADGVTATFSVSGMAPGTYIVQIHTRQGQLITKKLAVRCNR